MQEAMKTLYLDAIEVPCNGKNIDTEKGRRLIELELGAFLYVIQKKLEQEWNLRLVECRDGDDPPFYDVTRELRIDEGGGVHLGQVLTFVYEEKAIIRTMFHYVSGMWAYDLTEIEVYEEEEGIDDYVRKAFESTFCL